MTRHILAFLFVLALGVASAVANGATERRVAQRVPLELLKLEKILVGDGWALLMPAYLAGITSCSNAYYPNSLVYQT